ncbi:ABC transporter permease [bacterium]|nr:ABC transporter permease [bacterium]
MLRNFLKARSILWLLVRREFQTRYAGSTLGILWNVIHPIVMIAIYIIVFSNIMRHGIEGGSKLGYAIHLTSGIIPWFLFSEVLGRCTTTLVDNAGFLKKMAIPEEVLHVSILVNSVIIHTISMSALIALLIVTGNSPGPEVIYAFPVMYGLGALAMGVGMLLSVMHLAMRDVGQLVTVALQFLFWLTPIVYFVSILPERLRILPRLNPAMSYVSLIQRLFGSPDPAFQNDSYIVIVVLPFAAILIGLSFLRRHRSDILDEL